MGYNKTKVDSNKIKKFDIMKKYLSLFLILAIALSFAGTSLALIVTPPPTMPTGKEQCKNNGWEIFEVFKNQGDCVSFVSTDGKNQPTGN